MKKKGYKSPIDPEYLLKQKASLVRKHRQVMYFNDFELEAINAYREKFHPRSKASLYREIIMDKILSELEVNHPTLF